MKKFIGLICFLASFSLFAAPSATIKVTSAEYGEAWPFTVTSGTVGYEPLQVGDRKLAILTFESGGKIYALNGIARSRIKQRGFLEIDAIWRDNPKIEGLKINISPIIQRGLALQK